MNLILSEVVFCAVYVMFLVYYEQGSRQRNAAEHWEARKCRHDFNWLMMEKWDSLHVVSLNFIQDKRWRLSQMGFSV